MIARADVPRTVPIDVDGVSRELPVREVKAGLHLGILLLVGDPELTEAAGCALARRLPPDALRDAVLVMPEGKAEVLLHVVQRETGIRDAVVFRKQRKPYLVEPVLEVTGQSVTSRRPQSFYLGADDRARLGGRVAVVLDDVVSSGETIRAMIRALNDCKVSRICVMAVGVEGQPPPDIVALDILSLVHLPVYETEAAPC